jgi:hypothetical protein
VHIPFCTRPIVLREEAANRRQIADVIFSWLAG